MWRGGAPPRRSLQRRWERRPSVCSDPILTVYLPAAVRRDRHDERRCLGARAPLLPHPVADGDSLPAYSDVVSMRGDLWAFFVVAAVNLIAGACAAALAGWILTPARGPCGRPSAE